MPLADRYRLTQALAKMQLRAEAAERALADAQQENYDIAQQLAEARAEIAMLASCRTTGAECSAVLEPEVVEDWTAPQVLELRRAVNRPLAPPRSCPRCASR